MIDQPPIPSNPNPNPNTPTNKMFLLLLIAVIVGFGLVIILYIYVNFTQPKGKKVAMPSPVVTQKATILYPPKPSSDGRDIYYDIGITYSGSGVYPLIENSKNQFPQPEIASATAYMVGNFVKWEQIPNSLDKYLIISDYQKNYQKNSGKPEIPKIRVGYGKKFNLKTELVSGLAVEDLSAIIPNILNASKGTIKYSLGYIATWQDELYKIIKPGDVLTVTIIHDPRIKNKKADLVDSAGIKVAEWVYLRRFNPKEALVKELGREVTFK